MGTETVVERGFAGDGEGACVTRADLVEFEGTLVERFRQELSRFEHKLDKNIVGLVVRALDDYLRRRSLPAELGAEPTLVPRSESVEDMLAPFTLDGEGRAKLLSADPEMRDAESFAALAGITVQALHGKRKRGEVIGLQQAKRKYWFPIYQIDIDGRLLPGLPEVVAAFDGDMWRVHRFLAAPQGAFDGARGCAVLAEGRKDEVLTIIHGMRESGYM